MQKTGTVYHSGLIKLNISKVMLIIWQPIFYHKIGYSSNNRFVVVLSIRTLQ